MFRKLQSEIKREMGEQVVVVSVQRVDESTIKAGAQVFPYNEENLNIARRQLCKFNAYLAVLSDGRAVIFDYDEAWAARTGQAPYQFLVPGIGPNCPASVIELLLFMSEGDEDTPQPDNKFTSGS